jgi:hypothetical protein
LNKKKVEKQNKTQTSEKNDEIKTNSELNKENNTELWNLQFEKSVLDIEKLPTEIIDYKT